MRPRTWTNALLIASASRALKEPLRTILANGGHISGPILSNVAAAGQGCGFDLRTEQIVNMVEAGVIDSAEVMKTAVHSAFASAALALTVRNRMRSRR